MATGQRLTREFKITQCGNCKQANKAALRRREPACAIFLKTGQYPKITNGECFGKAK